MTEQSRSIGEQDRRRIEGAYRLDAAGGDAMIWDDILARTASNDGPITVIEIARLHPEARDGFARYLDAISAATAATGGERLAVCDIVEPGVGDLLDYMDYAGGVATLLAFPSRAAWLAALRSGAWQSGVEARQQAVADAIVLVAGENTIPPTLRSMLGEPKMPSEFPTPRVDGKSPEALVDEVLSVYPDGGADPSREQLEVMMHFAGFRDQPMHYINLYAFGEGDDPAVKGAAAHDAYNAAAMQPVMAHGGYPLLRAAVEHRVASDIPWSRVVFVRWPSLAVFTDMRLEPSYLEAQKNRVESAETYGNFVTVKREG